MACCVSELRDKEVINICGGRRLGYVFDVEVEPGEGKVVSLVVTDEGGGSLFGKARQYRIPFACVRHVGDDIVLVEMKEPEPKEDECCEKRRSRRSFFG